MTYDAKRLESKRQEVIVVDIELDQNDPLIDFSADPNSYNTPKTTQDPLAFNPDAAKKIYRFSNQKLGPNAGPHFPSLLGVSFTPPKLSPGKSIGSRAGVSISFSDFISNDVFELPAPYDDRRVTGSFWGKLFARNFVHNRVVRVHRGYGADFDLANFQTETYFVDTIAGPNINGRVDIKALDPLIFTEAAKAKAPRKSSGVLAADIVLASTQIQLTGAAAGEYGNATGSVIVVIGSEIIDCTVVSDSLLTINNRSIAGSQISNHSVGDLVQIVIYYDNINVVDIIRDLIEGYTSISSDFIPDAEWDAEKAGGLSTYNFTTYITKPTEVRKLLDDLILHSGASFFFDVVRQEITLEANPEFDAPVLSVNEHQHIEQDSLKIANDERDQVTRAAISWVKRDYTQSDDARYYRRGFEFVDGNAESAAQFAEINEADEIFSNWLIDTVEDTQTATAIAQRDVLRKSSIPTTCSFEIDSAYIRGNTDSGIWLGSVIEVTTGQRLNPDGTPQSLRYQVTELKAKGGDKWAVGGIAYSAAASNIDYTISTDKEDLVLTDIAPPIAGRQTVVLVSQGVTIGATTTANAALTTGAYPDGLLIINRGRVLGMGGAGGKGGDKDFDACLLGASGLDGGAAIELLADTVIDNGGGGLVYGGGGGGSGEDAFGCVPDTLQGTPGDGGGGGQGYATSAGGAGGDRLPFGLPGNPGTPGDQTGPGTFDANGGTWGQKGEKKGIVNDGGAGGFSFVTNGFSLNITSGNNEIQIKGAIN